MWVTLLALPFATVEAPTEVAIVPLVSGTSSVGGSLSDVVAESVSALADHPGVRAVGLEELESRGARLERLRGCRGEARCLSEHLGLLGVDYALVVAVNHLVRPSFVVVRLAARGRVLATRSGPSSRPSASIREHVSAVFDEVGFRQGARLTVMADPADAIIRIVGGSRVTAAQTILLSPGRYELTASREGYESTRVAVTLAPRASEVIELELDARSRFPTWAKLAIGTAAVASVAGLVFALLKPSGSVEIACLGRRGTTCAPP